MLNNTHFISVSVRSQFFSFLVVFFFLLFKFVYFIFAFVLEENLEEKKGIYLRFFSLKVKASKM